MQHLDLATAASTSILPMNGARLPVDLVLPVQPVFSGLLLYSQAVV